MVSLLKYVEMGAVCAFLSILVLIVAAVGAPVLTHAEGYRFSIPEVSAYPGQEITLAIEGEYEQSAQGFSLGLRYPEGQLTIREVSVEDTIIEAINADFVDSRVETGDGELGVAVLVEALPPFDDTLLPNIGQPLTLAHIEATVSPDATEDIVLTFQDGLFFPPLANLYVVGNQAVAVSELSSTTIDVLERELFIRGDANVDATVDISDPIRILNYMFAGRGDLPCERAADANLDWNIDISDSIYLLRFLFETGPPPPHPFPEPGYVKDPGNLSCERSLSA